MEYVVQCLKGPRRAIGGTCVLSGHVMLNWTPESPSSYPDFIEPDVCRCLWLLRCRYTRADSSEWESRAGVRRHESHAGSVDEEKEAWKSAAICRREYSGDN